MQKAVVTGGAGFIGSHLVDQLINQGVEVIILDDLSTGKKENINPKAKFVKYDISNIPQSLLVDYIKGADTIFHLAAKTTVQESIKDPILYNDVNVKGTLNLLKAATTIKIKRFVFSSSSSVYGNAAIPTPEAHTLNPISPYALNKLIGEQYCKPLTINNDGEQRRDFIHVNDVVSANIAAANFKGICNGNTYNIGSGVNYSINEIADMFGGKKQYGNKTIEPTKTLSDITKAKNKLNWKPKNKLKTWISTFTEQSSTE